MLCQHETCPMIPAPLSCGDTLEHTKEEQGTHQLNTVPLGEWILANDFTQNQEFGELLALQEFDWL